jgi:hypothetical protein
LLFNYSSDNLNVWQTAQAKAALFDAFASAAQALDDGDRPVVGELDRSAAQPNEDGGLT